MIDTRNSKAEIFGETMDVETDYEWDGGYPIIHNVIVIKQVAKKGQVFYDIHGLAHIGPAWKRYDMTDLLSDATIRSIAEEICQNATMQRFEDATERSMERFLFNRYSDPFTAPEPKNYTETLHEVCA
ncbi:MAG: hypothetical protein IPL59_18290 [Candidatus Competibacteraceae bacterium]|nr:hypothetical protein [Candidatus Competibacteraceae bacterium]